MIGGEAITLAALREFWVHTGTSCNLSCPFCHEGSQPGDTRIAAPAAAEVTPLLQAAADAGAERFAFTGGEPLIHREIVPILRYALSLRPTLVLTNGTAPLIRRPHHLAQLQGLAHPLSLRVSIDYPEEERHDAGRGLRNFRKALQGLKLLADAGFSVGITRLSEPGEDVPAIELRYRQLLRRQRLPDSLPIVAVPDLGRPGAEPASAAPGPRRSDIAPACSRSRMLLKRGPALTLGPCPLTDDRPDMDLGASLASALAASVAPRHARCATCLEIGVNYVGVP